MNDENKSPVNNSFSGFNEYRGFYRSILGPWACEFTKEARPGKPREDYQRRLGYRTEFQRDRDDILYSPSFRQMAYKRQIFSSQDRELFYTRLTHTLIVSQLARSIGRGLRLDENLIEAIALGHDLGHTPYGHSGEDGINDFINSILFKNVLKNLKKHGNELDRINGMTIKERIEKEKSLQQSSNDRVSTSIWQPPLLPFLDLDLEKMERLFLCKPDDTKIFSHNRQSYRIIQDLEKGGIGLALTLNARYGILRASLKCRDDDGFELKEENINTKSASFEAQVVRLADDIAWVNHDLTEDCKRNNRQAVDLLMQYRTKYTDEALSVNFLDLREFLSTGPGARYGKFVTDVIETNKNELRPKGYLGDGSPHSGYVISLSDRMKPYLVDMRNIVVDIVHGAPSVMEIASNSRNEISSICKFIYKDDNFAKLIPKEVYINKTHGKLTDLQKLRAITDAVAFLSDSQAHDFYEEHHSGFKQPTPPDWEPEPLEWPLVEIGE